MKIFSINISQKKGTSKLPVNSCVIDENGIVGDAHAGKSKRQISLLAIESINDFSKKTGRKFMPGEFAENITTESVNLKTLNIDDKIQIGNVILQVTQLGKKCHGGDCSIFREIGKCVMPNNGIFCKVVKTGTINKNDKIVVINDKKN